MKYLTLTQIEAAAKKSRKASIACTLRHWREMRDATLRKLSRAIKQGSRSTLYNGYSSCALCKHCCKSCRKCGLWDGMACYDGAIYLHATQSLDEYINNGHINNGRRKWQRAADKVIEAIENLK